MRFDMNIGFPLGHTICITFSRSTRCKCVKVSHARVHGFAVFQSDLNKTVPIRHLSEYNQSVGVITQSFTYTRE